MLLVYAPCLPVFLLVCVLCRPVCWTSLHPFDFFLLACRMGDATSQYSRDTHPNMPGMTILQYDHNVYTITPIAIV